MTKLFFTAAILFLFITIPATAQTIDSLKSQIQQIISTKNAVVGVSLVGNNKKDTLSINGEKHFPMQSVFKFHIALAVLSAVDKGQLSLNQKIKVTTKYYLPDFYSPIKDKYPNGTTLTIAEILKYTVSQSDNVGCEILLSLVGGPAKVEDFFVKNNFNNVSIKVNEIKQQNNADLQFKNWTTAKAANEVLASFYYNKRKLLSTKSYNLIWKLMRETETGKNRLRGQLPENTIVAHKTGSSGVNKNGITAAVNDIGIVFLPDGRYFFISIFVTNSKENADTNEKIIADISKLSWDYFMAKKALK